MIVIHLDEPSTLPCRRPDHVRVLERTAAALGLTRGELVARLIETLGAGVPKGVLRDDH